MGASVWISAVRGEFYLQEHEKTFLEDIQAEHTTTLPHSSA